MSVSNSHNGAMLSPEATQIETFSGGFVDVLHPEAETLKLEDIAHALSLTCRYGGHIKRFYSVAEHSILVHDLVRHLDRDRIDLRLAAMLHDAAEAYLGDVVAPLKYAQRKAELDGAFIHHGSPTMSTFKGAYSHLTDRMEKALGEAFDVDPALFDHETVKLADMWALRIEATQLTTTGGASWRWPGELPLAGKLPSSVGFLAGVAPMEAESVFLSRVQHLFHVIDLSSDRPPTLSDQEADRMAARDGLNPAR